MEKHSLKICYIGWASSIHLQRFIRWFAERGHEIVLISDRYFRLEGIKQYEIGIHKFRNKRLGYAHNYLYYRLKSFKKFSHFALSLSSILQIIRKEQPDIIHLHTLYFPSQLGVFTWRRPLVVMPWDGDIIWEKKRSLFHSLLVRYAMRQADAIPLQTEYLGKQCVDKYGAISDKINIIQFGVELDRFKRGGKDVKLISELQLSDNQVVISTRNVSYNVLNIVKALPYVIKEVPKAIFVFIWPPNDPLETELKELVEGLGVSEHVRLIGSVSHGKIPSYLSISDVFVSVSTIDCFPQSALEAMAMGIIPVMGDIPPLRVYMEDSFNGYLVDPGNIFQIAVGIIEALKMDSVTRELFIERNLNIVREKADFRKEMEKMENLYYQLVPVVPGQDKR